MVKEGSTRIDANYVLQTADEQPAYIVVKTQGWLTGSKDVLDKLNDPNVVDTINPSTYKYRVTLSMETGDERYAFVNTLVWVGSGCRRNQESKRSHSLQCSVHCANNVKAIIDAFRVN